MQITRSQSSSQDRLVCRTSVELKVSFNATLKQPFTNTCTSNQFACKCESKVRATPRPSLRNIKYLHVPIKMPLHMQVLYFVLQNCVCTRTSGAKYSSSADALLCWDHKLKVDERNTLKSQILSEISSARFTTSCVQWLHKFSPLSVD